MALYDHSGPNLIEPHDIRSIQRTQDSQQVDVIVSNLTQAILVRILNTTPSSFSIDHTRSSLVLPILSDVGETLWAFYTPTRYNDTTKEHDIISVCFELDTRLSQEIHTLLPKYKAWIQCVYYKNVYTLHCNWGQGSRMYDLDKLISMSSSSPHSSSSSFPSSIFTYLPFSLLSGCTIS
jgi:hypothetical protein